MFKGLYKILFRYISLLQYVIKTIYIYRLNKFSSNTFFIDKHIKIPAMTKSIWSYVFIRLKEN